MEKLLAKPAEAFAAIGVSRSTGYALLRSGAIPSVRLGRSVRVPVAELRSWVQKQAAASVAGTRS